MTMDPAAQQTFRSLLTVALDAQLAVARERATDEEREGLDKAAEAAIEYAVTIMSEAGPVVTVLVAQVLATVSRGLAQVVSNHTKVV